MIVRLIKRLFFGTIENKAPLYYPIPKHYVFNETGNILICSTDSSVSGLESYVKDSFTDVAVFFSAMTKALASTTNPETGNPFSIYNYDAMKSVFANSGMFIETSAVKGVFQSNNVGESLGKELVQKVLNKSFEDNTLAFTSGMFRGMSYQHLVNSTNNDTSKQNLSRGGQVFFVCELLNGLPSTSVILTRLEPLSGVSKEQPTDAEIMTDIDAQDIFKLGQYQEEEWKNKGNKRRWLFKKRTYLFIPPKFLQHASKNLDVGNVEQYEELVSSISDRLLKNIRHVGKVPPNKA